MILVDSLLATDPLLSPTKKRRFFSRLSLTEPTINAFSNYVPTSSNKRKLWKIMIIRGFHVTFFQNDTDLDILCIYTPITLFYTHTPLMLIHVPLLEYN